MNPEKLNRIFNILGNAFLEIAKEFEPQKIEPCPDMVRLNTFVDSLFDYNLEQTQPDLNKILNPPPPPAAPVVLHVEAEREPSSDSLAFQLLKQKDQKDKDERTEIIEQKVKSLFSDNHNKVEAQPEPVEKPKKKSRELSNPVAVVEPETETVIENPKKKSNEQSETKESVSTDETVHIPKVLRKYLKKFEIPYREFQFSMSDKNYEFSGEKTRENKSRLTTAGFKWNPNIRMWTIVKSFVEYKMSV